MLKNMVKEYGPSSQIRLNHVSVLDHTIFFLSVCLISYLLTLANIAGSTTLSCVLVYTYSSLCIKNFEWFKRSRTLMGDVPPPGDSKALP